VFDFKGGSSMGHSAWLLKMGFIVAIFLSGSVFASTLINIPEALDQIIPVKDSMDALKVKITPAMIARVAARSQTEKSLVSGQDKVFYAAKKNGKVSAVAVIDTEQGKWGLAEFMVAIDATTSKIQDMVVLSFEEKRGRPIARKAFLDQFIGKGAGDPIAVNDDIKGVSGATISSKSAASAARDAIILFEEVYSKR
jgi:Na+-translocating ferredoxin:NAD+ oxidoreductase RnfG subunit